MKYKRSSETERVDPKPAGFVLKNPAHSTLAHLAGFITTMLSHELYPTRLLCAWNSPGKNTGVGCHFLLQRIFLTQGSNLCLRHCRQILYNRNHQGSHCTLHGANLKFSLSNFFQVK